MINVLRVFEYDMACDECGVNEVLHTGDSDRETYVHNIHTAIKLAGFHRSRGQLLCDECFKKEKKNVKYH